jgi:phage terminase large subunit-like protein
MPPEASIFSTLADALERDWRFIARPEQLAPKGDWWSIWLFCGGRGAGKTRSGAEWVRENVETGAAGRIALVAPTASDARDVMIEGESGILATASGWCRPVYEPSKRRLTWPNGAIASVYSAEESERLRGPQHDAAWCDELGTWADPSTWDMLQFGLRLGRRPRAMVTTTPRATKLFKELVARAGVDVVITRSTTSANAANLAPLFLSQIVGRYAGTRLGRQELDGELIDDIAGALWSRALIDETRITPAELPDLRRIVVAVDPPATSGEDADEAGIIAAGIDESGQGYVLDDASGIKSPTEWAREAVALFRARRADRIVAERNNGGEMVENTIRMVDSGVPCTMVWASRGKFIRAEPISALYEKRRIHHVGSFPKLEDQMCQFTPDFDRRTAGYSPDRLDALVWAFTELMVSSVPGAGLLEYYRRQAESLKAAAATPEQVAMLAPEGVSTVITSGGAVITVGADRRALVPGSDVGVLEGAGWREVAAI